MDRHERERDKWTRRRFIRRSGTLGASVALAPFALDLTGCSGGPSQSSGLPETSAGTSQAAGGSAAPGSGSAGIGSSTAGSVAMGPSGSPAAGSNVQMGAAGAPASAAGSSAHDQAGAAAAPSGGAGGSQGSAGQAAMQASAIAKASVLLGLYKGDGMSALQAAAKKLDFSWLKSGDTVLIKVATNSQYKHPTTTSVNGVRAMVSELKQRGAGKVIVADQAGVEHVRLSAQGRTGKTSEMWSMNGMDSVTPEAEAYYFDDQPFDSGYVEATLPDGHHWPRGMYIPSVIEQADHIIYMPRIGTHILAGNTLSQKSAIGWLRDDSRHDLHNDAQDYYEKYTEVNYVDEIRQRLRLVVTVSEAVLLHGGPDTGTNYALDPVLVTASDHMANHDAIACSILVTLNKNITTVDAGTMTYSGASAPQNNAFFASGISVVTGNAGPWTSQSPSTMFTAHDFESGVTNDRAIARGWELSGGKPSSVQVVLDGEPLDDMLKTGLMMHGEGLYELS